MDNEKIKAYEHSIGEYLHTTIYNPDSLTEYLPKDKWFLMNPSRGARNGFVDYDMSINKDNLISEILKDAYGEIEACRYIVDNYTYRFNRRAVACGGALYPNNVYVFTQKQKSINIYQFIPALNILRLIKRIETGLEADEKVYFVYTNYYWRNWPKYKYFGYRLMQVDTGYAMANLSLLGNFIGMLTDSRSFLSYPRHDYFRRILCNLIGNWVENGEYPNIDCSLRKIVEGVCYGNAKRYFGM